MALELERKWVEWDELTEEEKQQAREQYFYIRSVEEERSEEEVRKAYGDTAVESCRGFERTIYRNGETHIFVNL